MKDIPSYANSESQLATVVAHTYPLKAMSRKRTGVPMETLANDTAFGRTSNLHPPRSRVKSDGDEEIIKGPYRVKKLPPPTENEVDNSWSSPSLVSNVLCIANLVNLGLWIAYLFCQVIFIYAVRVDTGQGIWQLWMAMLAESSIQFSDMLISLEMLLPRFAGSNKTIEASRYELLGEVAPTVDVMIACCGEDPQLIMDTVVAAAAQDYPADPLSCLHPR